MFDLNNTATVEEVNACDRMYNASFRSEPYVLSDEDFDDYSDDLLEDLILLTYCRAKNIDIDSIDDDRLESIIDYAEDCFYKTNPNFKINKSTKVVTLCNYKGEGDTLAIYEFSKDIPVFVNKSLSFHQA